MIVTSKTPSLDLHNEIEAMVESIVNTFIKDHVKMRNETVVIVHGISGGIVKRRLHEVLKDNKNVEFFKLDNWNIGQTIVKLKVKK